MLISAKLLDHHGHKDIKTFHKQHWYGFLNSYFTSGKRETPFSHNFMCLDWIISGIVWGKGVRVLW